MNHERYPLEERTKNHWRNPEWDKYKGKEFRPDNVFSQMPLPGVDKDNTPLINPKPQYAQVFPLETGQPGSGNGNFEVRVGHKKYLFIDNSENHE